MSEKLRLDDLMVRRMLAESKGKAQALIMAGKVWQGEVRLDKPGKKVADDIPLRVEAPPRFVSRGGEKLLAGLEAFPQVVVQGALCLDVGASTGGFTDCLLQHGAREVVAIDVGHAQMHPKVKNDLRVKNYEGINARSVSAEDLPHPCYDIIVMDLAFISQRKVLENVWKLLRIGGYFISLIKPQFEVSKQEADRAAGVIKDPTIHARVVAEVSEFATSQLEGCRQEGVIPSPILGSEGNTEFLALWHRVAP
jgi:23S rRNA (cytidine1920-2'-O)/16S rRNA (cytidine1409-2'-O)-methyltransferase